jgi:hypothetical protein
MYAASRHARRCARYQGRRDMCRQNHRCVTMRFRRTVTSFALRPAQGWVQAREMGDAARQRESSGLPLRPAGRRRTTERDEMLLSVMRPPATGVSIRRKTASCRSRRSLWPGARCQRRPQSQVTRCAPTTRRLSRRLRAARAHRSCASSSPRTTAASATASQAGSPRQSARRSHRRRPVTSHR